MGSLFRPRQSFLQLNAWQNSAINALHYNTSQQGSVIPLAYGTVRIPVNLVDFQDYKGPKGGKGKTGSLPVSGTQSRSGKGGSSKSGKKSNPNYSVDAMFAVCQGPIADLGQVYSSAGMASFSSLPLNFYSGADSQAADSVFVGFGSVVGYSGTAMVSGTPINLGPSPVLPNISVEVIGLLVGANTGDFLDDANPAEIIKDFLTNDRYGAGFPIANLDDPTALSGSSFAEYCQASSLLVSTFLDGHQKAIEWLDALTKLCNTAMFFSGKKLKFRPFGDADLSDNSATWAAHMTPVYDLTDDQFLPWASTEFGGDPKPGQDDPILGTRTNSADADNWLSIEYTDRSNFYNSTTVTVDDQGLVDTYGLRIGDSIQGRAFCNVTSATNSAQLIMQRKAYVRNFPVKFQLGWQYCLLEPMDIVSLTGRYGDLYLQEQPVRILSIEEDDGGKLTIEGEAVPVGAPTPPIIKKYIALDGTCSVEALGPFTVTTSGLTTTEADDIIIIHVTMLQNSIVVHTALDDIPRVDSITSSSGLTINVRHGPEVISGFPCGLAAPGCLGSVVIYWAHAPSILSSETFTITFNTGVGIASGLVGVGAFKNVNVSSPFDPSQALPRTLSHMSADVQWPYTDGVFTVFQNAALVGCLSGWSPVGGGIQNINLFNHISNQQAIQVFDGMYTTGCQSWKPTTDRLALTQEDFNCAGGRCGFSLPNYWWSYVDALRPRFVY